MIWWLALTIFTFSILDDIGVVFYLRRVVSGKRGMAAILSGILTGIISLEVVIYATDPVYIPFNCLGSVIGTWLAMWLEDRLPRVRPRTNKGRFKPTSGVAEFQQRNKIL
jgi:hypothetical protein